MDWKKFFLMFVRNAVICVGIITLLLGLFGYLLGGPAGFVNAAKWGAALGLFVAPFAVGDMILVKFWGGYGERITQSRFRHESQSRGDPDAAALDRDWPAKK